VATIGAFVEELGVEELAKGGALARKFDKRPNTVMKEFGLSAAQINKVFTGSRASLRSQVETDLNQKVLVFRVKRG
jgi:hypothetical protein